MRSVAKNFNIGQLKTKLFVSLALLVFLSTIFYIYLVVLTVVDTVGWEETVREMAELERDYHQIEEVYLVSVDGLSLEYALSLGFVENDNEKFVSRPGTVAKR